MSFSGRTSVSKTDNGGSIPSTRAGLLLMKLFKTISIIILLFAGLILVSFPVNWFPSFYDARYMGLAAINGAAAIIILPRILNALTGAAEDKDKKQAINLFQFLLTVSIMSNALGDIGLYQLYKIGFQYDKLIHFSTSLLGVFIGAIILHKLFEIRLSYAVVFAFIAVIVCSIGWEVFERISDFLFKTRIAGVYASDVSNDTKFDLLSDVIGTMSGAILVYCANIRKRLAGTCGIS